MASKLDHQIITNEFEFHWVPHSFGLVSYRSKIFQRFKFLNFFLIIIFNIYWNVKKRQQKKWKIVNNLKNGKLKKNYMKFYFVSWIMTFFLFVLFIYLFYLFIYLFFFFFFVIILILPKFYLEIKEKVWKLYNVLLGMDFAWKMNLIGLMGSLCQHRTYWRQNLYVRRCRTRKKFCFWYCWSKYSIKRKYLDEVKENKLYLQCWTSEALFSS